LSGVKEVTLSEVFDERERERLGGRKKGINKQRLRHGNIEAYFRGGADL
jgi:hypothetical protein